MRRIPGRRCASMIRPRLLFVNQHYYPDVASTGQHLTDLAEHLAAGGFEVDVLCGSGRYVSGALGVPRREARRGVQITRARTTAFGRGTHVGRLLDYATFFAQVLTRLLFRRRYDLVVYLTTPPLLAVVGLLAKRVRGASYAIWSMDLHPGVEEAVGVVRRGGLRSRVLHALNDAAYRNAEFVVDLGPYMKRYLLAHGIRADRLYTIPVWSKRDEIYPLHPAENGLRRALGLEDKFVVMYSGNAGLVHRFGEVLEVMRRLRRHPDVFFLFAGGGPRKGEIASFVKAEGIENFLYLDYVPREQLAESLGVGDVHLLTLDNATAGLAVPGKLYGIMAAGRPVVVVGPAQSEPADTALHHGAGFLVNTEGDPPDAADHLEATLLRLHAEPELRARVGAQARAAFLAHFEQVGACKAWSALLADEVGSRIGAVDWRAAGQVVPRSRRARRRVAAEAQAA